MPSPLGHVIAGAAAGWLIAGTPGGRGQPRRGIVRDACLFGALGALPDVDLIFGAHSGPTHSLAAAAIVSAAIVAAARSAAMRPRIVTAAACFAAYASHVLLDWLATDSSPPIGIMALWPFSREHYESDLHVFMAISRRYWTGWSFVRQNAIAVARELAILLPLLAVIVLARTRGRPRAARGEPPPR
jgi:hypothetical protein